MKQLVNTATFFASIGGLLCGYHISMMYGILKDTLNRWCIMILWIGCVLGALLISIPADRFGRRHSCMASSLLFIIGGLWQTLSEPTLVSRMPALFILGLAIGSMTMIVPLYVAEIAPKDRRGLLVSAQPFTIMLGMLLAYCVRNCMDPHQEVTWHIVFGLPTVLAAWMILGLSGMPSSPRWLMSRGRVDLAIRDLRRLRGQGGITIQQELDDIQDAIRLEQAHYTQSSFWQPLWIGMSVQLVPYMTGIYAILHPTVNPPLDTLWMMVGVGIAMLSSLLAALRIDRLGRRPLLYAGTTLMMVAILAKGILLAIHTSPTYTPAWIHLGIGYLFLIGYASSWGLVSWIYPTEIFPTRRRARALALTTAVHWLNHAAFATLTPSLLNAFHGWGAWILLVTLHFCLLVWLRQAVCETKGQSLDLCTPTHPLHLTKSL
jgi:MFS family permease